MKTPPSSLSPAELIQPGLPQVMNPSISLEEGSSAGSGTTPVTVMWSSAEREGWVPVSSGRAFRIDSPSENGMVTSELAQELHDVFERFARDAAFDERKPVGIFLR